MITTDPIRQLLLRFSLPVAMLLGSVVGGASVLAQTPPGQPPPLGPTLRPVGPRDLGTWQYQVSQERPGTAQVSIGYDHSSVGGLKGFVKTNAALAEQFYRAGTSRFEALVTFNRPLTLIEFSQLVDQYHLNVQGYTMRMQTPNGERWTITGGPANGVLVPQEKLEFEKQFIHTRAPNASFAGVVDVAASFTAEHYTGLQAASGVFLVDITRTLARQEAARAAPEVPVQSILINESQPYSFMEDLGLEKFR